MRSREEIESLVKEKIENLSNTQKTVIYQSNILAGEKFSSTIEQKVVEQEYPDLDVEGHKQHLLENFDETVRLTVAREIGGLLSLLRDVQDVKMIPGIGIKGIGDVCNFTLKDIRDLKLDDPDFISVNFDEIFQKLYESYGFKNHIPSTKEINDKAHESTKARKEGAKQSDVLRILKEQKLMENERAEGEFTLDGLPLELREDCDRRMDEEIQQAEQIEAEGQEKPKSTEEKKKITGQDLGKETIEEQRDTSAKQIAMKRLNALRERDEEKLQ